MHKQLTTMREREDGFTLVELLIVVLIIGILAAIAIPVYLGIQNQAHKSAVRADVNIKVKAVQVALTGGATIASQLGTTNGSETGETLQIKPSTTTGAGANDFMVVGSESTTATPKGAINYTYTYDSVTGQFTDSDSSTALGGGNSGTTAAIGSTVTPAAMTYSKIVTTAALPVTGPYAIDSNERNFAVDSNNNTYYVCGVAICKLTPTGTPSLVAGSISGTPADGTGTAAVFKSIVSIAIDSSDNLYAVDRNGTLLTVRKINTSTTAVTTTAIITGFPSYNCNSGTQIAVGPNNTLSIISINSVNLQYTMITVNADGTSTKTPYGNVQGGCYYGTSIWVDGTNGTTYFTGYNLFNGQNVETIFKVPAGSTTATAIGNSATSTTSIAGSAANNKLYSQSGRYITQNDINTTAWTTNTTVPANVVAGNGGAPGSTTTVPTPGSVGDPRWFFTAASGRLYFIDNVSGSYWIRYLSN